MNGKIEFDGLLIDFDSRQVFLDGHPLILRRKEFDLLGYFLEHSNRVVTRTELLEAVWDRNICCSTNTVDVHMSNLRRKLKDWSISKFLQTVHCIGYRFCR